MSGGSQTPQVPGLGGPKGPPSLLFALVPLIVVIVVATVIRPVYGLVLVVGLVAAAIAAGVVYLLARVVMRVVMSAHAGRRYVEFLETSEGEDAARDAIAERERRDHNRPGF